MPPQRAIEAAIPYGRAAWQFCLAVIFAVIPCGDCHGNVLH